MLRRVFHVTVSPMPMRPPMLRPRALRPSAPERERGSASARGYDRAWQRVRLLHLSAEPLCRFCSARSLLVEATVVDHIRTIRERPDLRLDRANLRSLCKPCHDGHTAQQTTAMRCTRD